MALMKKLREVGLAQNLPLNVTLELTTRCNIKCDHCYNYDRRCAPPAAQRDELSDVQILDLIDQIAAAGGFSLHLSGGEALLHRGLFDFIARARQHHLQVTLKTNGVALAPKVAKRLDDAGVSQVDISIYGGSAQSHDTFTHAPGSFEKTLAGIRAAAATSMEVQISYCLMQQNAHEVDAIFALAQKHQTHLQIDPQITGRHDGDLDPVRFRVDENTLRGLYAGPLAPLIADGCHQNESIHCACAQGTCGITANGLVYPCIGAPIEAGNIREKSFAEIWHHSPVLQRLRNLSVTDFPTCAPCELKSHCQRSSGSVLSSTGDYYGADAWTCMQAQVLKDCGDG